MAHGTIVGIYRLLHLIAEEAHLAPQIILHAPLYEFLYRLLPLLAIRQIKHHGSTETIRQTTLGKLGVRLVVSQLSQLRLEQRIILSHYRIRSEIGTDDGGKRKSAHGSISHLSYREELLGNGDGTGSIPVETGLYAGCNALGAHTLLTIL